MGPDAQTDKWDVGTARLATTFWLIFARPVKVPAVQTVTHFYVDDIYKIEEERLWYECRQQLLIPAVILLRPPLFFFLLSMHLSISIKHLLGCYLQPERIKAW